MKVKRLIALVCTSVFILSIGVSGFASTETEITTNIRPIISTLEDKTIVRDRTNKQKPSDEKIKEIKARKEAMRNKFEIMNKKWIALNKTQKNEVYSLVDDIIDTKNEILDKYFEFGLIDEVTYTQMKKILSERKIDIRKEDRIPMFGIMGGKHPKIKK